MGFLDNAFNKGKDLLAKNSDKVDQAIDKAGDMVDRKTQGKYADTVDKVQEAAKNAISDQTGTDQTGTEQTGTDQPGAGGQDKPQS
ncbi:antitoxin [Mycolicibacterium palauense]|uniref:antitoxin n=1 Tax=Mycolicibacterium palauense TaxID=2034511 RepID=UPI000BFEF948|nr:antitoxin [Mycolicibacterium palauense]